MKKIISLLIAITVIISSFAVLPLGVMAAEKPVIKNVIYMIPDGGGFRAKYQRAEPL